jgi:hypothetical protein
MSIYLTDIHLIGIHLMDIYLMDEYLTSIHLMSVSHIPHGRTSYRRVLYERVLYERCLRSPAMTILTTDKMQLFYSVVRTYSRLLVVAGLVSYFSFRAKRQLWRVLPLALHIQHIARGAP